MLVISPLIISNFFVLIDLLAEWIPQKIQLKASESYLGITELLGSQDVQGQEPGENEGQERETYTQQFF